MARATLRDVAARSGVSVRTVSNVVTGAKTVAPQTRERVQQAVAELGYRPNMVARSLRSGRSNIICVAVPELSVPYFGELVGEIAGRARDFGYVVMVDQTDGLHEREIDLLATDSRAQLFDGLIVSTLRLTRAELRDRDRRTPLVLLGEHLSDGSFDHVGIDNVAAARDVTGHLLSLGRRRVAAIGAQPWDDGGTAELRLLGYGQAHRLAGLAVDPSLVVRTTQFRRRDGAVAMAALLDLADPPDAVFCFNDLLALGALRTLHDRGVDVPGRVAVAGFDDDETATFSVPSLTSVAPDKQAIAREALALLLSRIAETATTPRDVWVGYRLQVRESTDPHASAGARTSLTADRADGGPG